MSTARAMTKRGGVGRWVGHNDRKLNYSSSSLDSDESDIVGNNHTKGSVRGSSPMSVRRMRNTPPPGGTRSSVNTPSPGSIRTVLNTPSPGSIRTVLNTPSPTVKHLGNNDGMTVNRSVNMGGKSFNTTSSARIRGKTTSDKKVHQNSFTTMIVDENKQIGHTSTMNHTNKVSVMPMQRILDEPALVKDHIPGKNNNNESKEAREDQKDKVFQEGINTQKDKELQKSKDSLNDKEREEGRNSLKDEMIQDGRDSQKEKQFPQGSDSQEDKLLREERDIHTDQEFQNGGDSRKYKEFPEKKASQRDTEKDKDLQEGEDSQKDEEFQEETNSPNYIDTPADKSDENGDKMFSKSVNINENNIHRSVSQSKMNKSFEIKNSMEIQNNNMNKKHSINEDNKVKTRIQNPEAYVGFGRLPDQVCKKAVRRGFEFTLMVVGESGLGKSTLVNSMFLTDIYSSKFPGAIPNVPKTLNVETHKVMLEEGGVKLSLTVVDTPGFGDAVDNTGCWEPITNFIDQQYEKFLQAETRVNRVELPDTRVHVCLYFITPSGHGLKPLDIEFMSKLHHNVNIIPVIGKADACTTEELKDFKQKILAQIADSKIQIYSVPEGENNGDDWMRNRMPFAVVGSNAVIEGGEGKRLRGRKYPWGTVIIENKNHCDFLPLRDLLLACHMQDLKDVTNYVHYENFRCRRLTEMFSKEGRTVIPNKNPLAALENDTKEHMKNVEKTMEDMEEVFERKVEEKEERLKESEINMDQKLQETKEKLEEQKNELDKQREEFLKEKRVWENNNLVSTMKLRRKQSLESLLDGKKKRYGLGMMTFKIGRTKNEDF